MWRLAKPTSHGGNSVRSVFTVVITALLAVLLLTTTVLSSETHAADASWNGSSISYQGDTYHGPVSATSVKDLGLFDGVQAYTYVEPAPSIVNPSSGSSSSSNSPPGARHIQVIYFGKDVDVSSATKAQYRVYDYQGQTTFTNPSNPVDISIDAQSGTASAGTSACEVDWGVGWWICPITNFLAWGTDQIFDLLAGFLVVQPPQTGQDNALYRAWSYMRSIANVAFVIVFLIIIYSQISSVGVGNYGIKKLLPRLIIAALLVNLSYYICAIAIDVSNIIGYSLQDIFMNIRNGLVGAEGNGYELLSWQSITGFILSGGTAATAGLVGGFVVLTDFGIGGSLFLLLPALVAALLALLIALFVMAARQAIIIILVIISPLAFVAYLLPNTEKWFEKWQSTLVTMLVLFPAFSVVFGGSQLAGTAMIQSADSINLVLLGMMVQVAPLFITPILMRLGGDLLRQIGGLANKPRDALQGAVKNYTKDRTDNIKARRLRDLDPNKFQPLRRGAHWRDSSRRNREELAKAAGAEGDARWANDARFRATDQRTRNAGDIKALGESLSETEYNTSKTIPRRYTEEYRRLLSLDKEKNDGADRAGNYARTTLAALKLSERQQLELNLRNVKAELEDSQHTLDLQYKELQVGQTKANPLPGVASIEPFATKARKSYIASRALKDQIQIAESMQTEMYAKELTEASKNLKRNVELGIDNLLVNAGGIDVNGQRRVLASAKNVIDEAISKAIKEVEATNGIEAGDVVKLAEELKKSRADGDLAGVVAFTNILGKSQNAGIAELRKTITELEQGLRNGSTEEQDLLKDWKQYINANNDLNTYAEDIASWSRPDPKNKKQLLRDRFLEKKTWADLTLRQWASQKSSTQFASMAAGGYMDPKRAREILDDKDLKSSLKQKVVKQLEYYAAGYDKENNVIDPNWTEPIFKSDGTAGNPTSTDQLNDEWRENIYDFNHKPGGPNEEDIE